MKVTKVTKDLINSIVRAIDFNCNLGAYDVHIESEENGEYIVRYKDFNDFTCSIYFSNDDVCSIGYFDENEVYKPFCLMEGISLRHKETFIMDVGVFLYRLREFIADREFKEDMGEALSEHQSEDTENPHNTED